MLIGQVVYRLRLPEGACLPDVFHVGLLKPFHGEPPSSTLPLPLVQDGCVVLAPARVHHARLGDGAWGILVEWHGPPANDATWEPRQGFIERYPTSSSRMSCLPKRGEMLRPASPGGRAGPGVDDVSTLAAAREWLGPQYLIFIR